MPTFDELKQKVKACKSKAELDAMRLPLVQFVPQGGSVEDFHKLQKIFRTQKIKVARGTAG